MRPIFWVTALAVLSLAHAKNSTEKVKSKPKRQLDSIRSPENFQYSLILPHSKVAHFRAINTNRRISGVYPRGGKLPPYAVQMEPVVQYSQKDPLYDRNLDNIDDTVVNKNEIYAQPKILHVSDQYADNTYDPPYGSLPTAPLYSHEPHHYYQEPEPIIEIIIKESNESLPAPPSPPVQIQKKKKEPVQVFYVKYSKDPLSKDKVIYEKPIPAITPASNVEDDHHDDYVTVTPEPYYIPVPSTTLRAIIKPESEVYHSDNGVKITFGSEENHHSDRREGSNHHSSEDHEETAPQPAIAFPHDAHPSQAPSPLEQARSISSNIPALQPYRPLPQPTQGRIQFQQPSLPSEQQLPKQGLPALPFRSPPHLQNQNSFKQFGPGPTFSSPIAFPNGPGPVGQFSNSGSSGPISHQGPFPTIFPRPTAPTFRPRPNNSPPFGPRPHFNGPSRSSFHSGPRPLHLQSQPFFDEAKYLQENYHTITTEQLNSPKEQKLPARQNQGLNLLQKPSPSPSPAQFQEQRNRPPHLLFHQQLPQQRPPPQFTETTSNRSPFYNLKPSPPLIENNRPPFQPQPPQQQPFSFHPGPTPIARPSIQIPLPQNNKPSFPGPVAPPLAPESIPQHQFVPQPSSPTLFNFHSQPSPTDRPQFDNSFNNQAFNNPSERPSLHQEQHQSVSSFVPQGGELIASIPKYEQHITVSGTAQPDYSNLGGVTPNTDQRFHQSQPQTQQHYHSEQQNLQLQQHQHLQQHQQPQQYRDEQHQIHQQQQQQQQQYHEQQQKQQEQQQQYRQDQQKQQQQQYRQDQQKQQQQLQQYQQDLQKQQQQQQQYRQEHQKHKFDADQELVKQQLAQNVKKQQDEIERLQSQLLLSQQQQQQQQQQNNEYDQNYHQIRNYYNQQVQDTSRLQQNQERSRNPSNYVTSSSPSSSYYQSTSRTVEIKPTTQKYPSSTLNSIAQSEPAKKDDKKKPTVELPDEVPDDLRQQLLSSGILDHADISVLDYDKVGETPLESLPPDQLANFFGAGGGQHLASSENRPVVVKPNGDQIESRIDQDMDEDQELAASENIPSYIAPAPSSEQGVEMKVVHFDPNSDKGQNIAQEYVKEDATQLEPVELNDKKYNRYLPLKVSGHQFPLPDVLKGRKITSVVVLAPVETEVLGDHTRAERAAANNLKGIKFIAGESLQDLLKQPTKENFEKWLDTEKKTALDLQSVVLLVLSDEDQLDEKEIFMYDISSGNVNKLSGELSNAFVEAAENNSLSKDIENLAIEGEGVPEHFSKTIDDDAEASDNVPFIVDLSGLRIDQDDKKVLISSGYSKTKHGRSLRRHQNH